MTWFMNKNCCWGFDLDYHKDSSLEESNDRVYTQTIERMRITTLNAVATRSSERGTRGTIRKRKRMDNACSAHE